MIGEDAEARRPATGTGAAAGEADVAIAGAGPVGRVLALALKGAAGAGLKVRLLEASAGPRAPDDIRTYAIAATTARMLGQIGVWQRLESSAQPAREMRITDSRLAEAMRPVLMTIGGEARAGEPFVQFVDGRDLQKAVAEACEAAGLEIAYGTAVSGMSADGRAIRIDAAAGSARLVVGADGARSAVRRAAGIGTVGWSYGQAAIITIIEHEVPHGGAAVQHFLPGGPFALLPLPGNRSGIVWTEREADARALAGLPADDFAAQLARRAGPEVGRIDVVEAPKVFPLGLEVARAFVAQRVVLVGDAAHRLHPLAGLGLNMGFRDVAALSEVVVDAARRGEDIGAPGVLERYQRWRRFETIQVATATDALNRLFSNDLGPLRALRDLGLGLADRIGPLKRLFVAEATGDSGRLPRLMRGEPV